MIPLPDWAPNVHPMLVHLPLAILIASVLFDLAGVVLRRWPWIERAAVALFVLGAIGALAAVLTGHRAAATVFIPPDAVSSVNAHEEWGVRTVWFFGVYALVRLGLLAWAGRRRPLIAAAIFLVGLAGMFPLYETGDRGAELVFRHGIGVIAARDKTNRPADTTAAGNFRQTTSGWTWTAGAGADGALRRDFRWLAGAPESAEITAIGDDPGGAAVAINPRGGAMMFVAGPPIADVQASVEVNLDRHAGSVAIVANVKDAGTYTYLVLDEGRATLGFVAGGARTAIVEGRYGARGWLSARIGASGGHYRGYVNDSLVVHGHGVKAAPGPVGIRLEGGGPALIRSMTAERLPSGDR